MIASPDFIQKTAQINVQIGHHGSASVKWKWDLSGQGINIVESSQGNFGGDDPDVITLASRQQRVLGRPPNPTIALVSFLASDSTRITRTRSRRWGKKKVVVSRD
jgi:hypothetical protein